MPELSAQIGTFEPEIRAFELADSAHPSATGGVVFVGSSSIKYWTNVAADFPGIPVLNRGFGGAGDNDLAMGRSPDRLVADYRSFVTRLRASQPGTRLAFISIKPSPSRRALIPAARETNRLIRAEVARDSLQTFVDVFSPMLGPGGEPRPELYLADSLHMTRAGYRLWRQLLDGVVH